MPFAIGDKVKVKDQSCFNGEEQWDIKAAFEANDWVGIVNEVVYLEWLDRTIVSVEANGEVGLFSSFHLEAQQPPPARDAPTRAQEVHGE